MLLSSMLGLAHSLAKHAQAWRNVFPRMHLPNFLKDVLMCLLQLAFWIKIKKTILHPFPIIDIGTGIEC